jgi:adenylate cyclase
LTVPPRLLIVDDNEQNLRLLTDVLVARGYFVLATRSAREALETVREERPDMVLLDVVMPEMSGYEVCRRIREDPQTRLLPVVMITALDPAEERVRGIEAGADDFLTKPIHQGELLARVRSLLQIKELHETVRRQADQLEQWSQALEQRVAEQTEQIRRLERLKHFFSPRLAQLIADGRDDLLKPHRRRIVSMFTDLRGFTAFAENNEPEDVMSVLGDYHRVVGVHAVAHEGTVGGIAGDGLLIFFNDPLEVENPEQCALQMAVAVREEVAQLCSGWKRMGYELGLGIGISAGYATLGVVGYENRWEYTAIGTVTNLAARLCAKAEPGQILIPERLLTAVEDLVDVRLVGEVELKGLRSPVRTHEVLALKPGAPRTTAR